MLSRNKIRFLMAIIMMGVSIASHAQNKVVVVPMAGDDAYQIMGGQTLTGVLIFQTPAGDADNEYVTLSFASPLPPGLPAPTISTGVSLDCPVMGSAASGILCLYPTFTYNAGEVRYSSGNTTASRRFGFILFHTRGTNAEFFQAGYAWAYRVP